MSDDTCVAALVQMLPGDMRDVVCQSLDAGSTHRGGQDKVQNLVSNRVCLEEAGHSPMQVGAEEDGYEDGEVEVCFGAIGRGSRECNS